MERTGNMNKTLLFIYNNPLDGSYGGSQGTLKALEGLKLNFNVEIYSCIKKHNKIATLWRNICGYSGNLDSRDCKKILRKIKERKYNIVYLDVSLHGKLAKKIKNKFTDIKVVINYHNCEAKYFKDMYAAKGFLYYVLYKSATKNESLSKKYADFNVFITEEDRKELGITSNYCIIPVTLDDKFYAITTEDNILSKEPYLLFIGAAQYANIEGAKYLINKIAPHINKKIIIAGKGMKSVFTGSYKNIEIIDYVPSLSELYKNASAFVSPLFYGSGAKVKVAEALMYGKKIIGTPLTFFGYDIENADCSVCNKENEFIKEINNLDMSKRFYKKNRELFLEKYSAENNAKYYSQIKSVLKESTK